jgi:hypothetical protein
MYDAITWSTWPLFRMLTNFAALQLMCSLSGQCQQLLPQQPVLPLLTLLTLLLGICVAAASCAAADCSFRGRCVLGFPCGVWPGCKREYSSNQCLGHKPLSIWQLVPPPQKGLTLQVPPNEAAPCSSNNRVVFVSGSLVMAVAIMPCQSHSQLQACQP